MGIVSCMHETCAVPRVAIQVTPLTVITVQQHSGDTPAAGIKEKKMNNEKCHYESSYLFSAIFYTPLKG